VDGSGRKDYDDPEKNKVSIAFGMLDRSLKGIDGKFHAISLERTVAHEIGHLTINFRIFPDDVDGGEMRDINNF